MVEKPGYHLAGLSALSALSVLSARASIPKLQQGCYLPNSETFVTESLSHWKVSPSRTLDSLPTCITWMLVFWMSSIGCKPRVEPAASTLGLHELVGHQIGNVTTDFVSSRRSIGLDQIEFGLYSRQVEGIEGRVLEIEPGVGRLALFSADGDLVALDIEAGLPPSTSDEAVRLLVRLNGERIKRVKLTAGLESYRIEIPDHLVRPGRNTLELHPRPSRRQQENDSAPPVLVRRLRLRSSTGRSLWPERPERIDWFETDDASHKNIIVMPNAAFVDMVVNLPDRARLTGGVVCELAEQSPMEAYVTLLDAQQESHPLFSTTCHRSSSRPVEIEAQLARWSGQTVRLRVGLTGRGNGIARWNDVMVATPEQGESFGLAPTIDREPPPRSGLLGRPDVVVILLDAARADAFSPFGAKQPTPGLERLAAAGTRFTHAISPSPWTGQSVPSILTSLFPDTLGIGAWGSNLPESVPTIAELMAQAGYRTVLWSQHPFYRNRKGLQRGFEVSVRAPRGGYDFLPDTALLIDDERPTFSWLHFIPPHTPYRPPEPFFGSLTGWYSGGTSVEASFLSRFPHRLDPAVLSGDDKRYIWQRYLENAVFADDLVRRVIENLDLVGRYDDALVVVLSDHGEAFLEHGRYLHTDHVYREFLRVPFVIKWPATVGPFQSKIDEIVPLIDLVPTLVDGLQLETDGTGFQGRSLLPILAADRLRSGPYFASTRGDADRSKAPRPEIMFEHDGWRTIYSTLRDQGHLFRPQQDPDEQSDLAAAHPNRLLLMRQSLLRQSSLNRSLLDVDRLDPPGVELDSDTIEQLQALGYLD